MNSSILLRSGVGQGNLNFFSDFFRSRKKLPPFGFNTSKVL